MSLDVAEIAEIADSSLTDDAYNNWTLNSTGIAAISKTGYTKFKQRYSGDVDNETPPNQPVDYGAVTDGSTATNPPKISVTYTVPSGSGHYARLVNLGGG
jgi:hypothetical protein